MRCSIYFTVSRETPQNSSFSPRIRATSITWILDAPMHSFQTPNVVSTDSAEMHGPRCAVCNCVLNNWLIDTLQPDALPAAQLTASKHWRQEHWRHSTHYSSRSNIRSSNIGLCRPTPSRSVDSANHISWTPLCCSAARGYVMSNRNRQTALHL